MPRTSPGAPDVRPSAAVEDYLKTVFVLGERGGAVTTTAVARRLGVSASGASSMIRRLADDGLVDHARYGEVALSTEGRALALGVVRRHRLVETYLVTALGMTWDEVHDEAEVLEHAVSDRLVARLAEQLGHPDVDPHGDPIPSAGGEVPPFRGERLSTVGVGTRGRLVRVDDDPEILRHLSERGVALGDDLTLVARRPFDGPFLVRIGREAGRRELDLAPGLVRALWIRS